MRWNKCRYCEPGEMIVRSASEAVCDNCSTVLDISEPAPTAAQPTATHARTITQQPHHQGNAGAPSKTVYLRREPEPAHEWKVIAGALLLFPLIVLLVWLLM